MDTEIDLAEGSFIMSWPDWLRWLLFLPAAAILSVLISGIIFLINTSFNDVREGSFLYNLIDTVRTGIIGALFVYIGSYVAPKHQFNIAIILAATGSAIGGVLLWVLLVYPVDNKIWSLLSIAALFFGVIFSTIAIRKELY